MVQETIITTMLTFICWEWSPHS